MIRALPSVLLAIGGLASASHFVQARQASSGCAPCKIRMERIATISETTAPGMLGSVHAVAVDDRDRILVTSRHATSQVDVFDFSGRFVQSVGRSGEGPGEFRDINLIVPVRERIHVFDQGNVRWTTLDSELDIVGQNALPHRPLAAAFWKDSLILNAAESSQERTGYTLHVLSREARMTRSFAYDSSATRHDIPYAGERELTVCPGSGALYVAEKRQYRITRYSVRDAPVRISRNVSWFRPHFRAPRFQPDDGAPPPVLLAIRCDVDGLLWVIINVADENWRTSLRPAPPGPHGPGRYTAADKDRYFDSVIEVLDPETGRIVAAGRTDYYIGYFPADDIVASYRESENGRPLLALWRVELQSPRH